MDTPKKEFNPFQPPAASLEVAPELDARLWFTASPLKFVLMSIATFNIYLLYWFYMNFRVIRDTSRPGIMPFWRAFFSMFWAYSCFREIAASVPTAGRSPGALAVAYFVLNALAWLPDPWWMVTFAGFVPVMAANGWAREANLQKRPDYPENSRLSGWNWAGIIVGGLLLALMTVGFFIGEPA
jgi:hypothetical protein